MDLKQAASMSFVRIEASWPAGRSHALVERLGPTHVILRRGGPPELYYLVPGHEASYCLGRISEAAPTGEAFDRAGLTPTPLVDGHEDVDTAPYPCIVLDEGRILGVYDAGEPVAFELMAGSSDESGGRSLVAEFPEQIALHREASLLVSLVGGFGPAGSLAVELPEGSEVDVVVQPRRGLSLVGTGEGRLVVTGDAECLPLQFKVRGEEPGRGLLRILAFHQGRPLGLISLAPVVTGPAGSPGPATRAAVEPLAPATARLPDLSLLILEAREGAETILTLRLTSTDPALGYNLKLFGPIRLRSDPYAYLQDFFRDIEAARRSAHPPTRPRPGFQVGGYKRKPLRALVPEDLRRALWGGGRITLGAGAIGGAPGPLGTVQTAWRRCRRGRGGSVLLRGVRADPLASRLAADPAPGSEESRRRGSDRLGPRLRGARKRLSALLGRRGSPRRA